ncbi:hypothetical protein D3C83_72310 [compost metagenome]
MMRPRNCTSEVRSSIAAIGTWLTLCAQPAKIRTTMPAPGSGVCAKTSNSEYQIRQATSITRAG